MKALVLGVGNAFSAMHYGSSALLQVEQPSGAARDHPGSYVLIDCPDPIHRIIREAGAVAGWDVDVHRIDDIILTHLHGDHSNGLESFAFARAVRRLESGGDGVLPRLYAIRPVIDRLWEKLAPAMDGPIGYQRPSTLEDFFDVRILRTTEETQIAGLGVRCRRTGHSVPTIGLRIKSGSGVLGWSGDTPFEKAHVDWLSEADVIVHEASPGPVHTPIDRLNELPEALKDRMRLIHLPDDFDPDSTDIRILAEGDVIEI